MKRGFLDKLIERLPLVQPGEVQNYLVEIAREKGFLETIFNAILEGVIVTNPEGRILYINRAACGFFGIDADASLGKQLAEVIRGIDWDALGGERNEIVSRDWRCSIRKIASLISTSCPCSPMRSWQKTGRPSAWH
jgi:PAS domain-containing protein